jgi:hypothetical protein
MSGLSVLSAGIFLSFMMQANAQTDRMQQIYTPDFSMQQITYNTNGNNSSETSGYRCGCVINVNCRHNHINAHVSAPNQAADKNQKSALLSAHTGYRWERKPTKSQLIFYQPYPVFAQSPAAALLAEAAYDRQPVHSAPAPQLSNGAEKNADDNDGGINIQLAEKIWLTMEIGYYQGPDDPVTDPIEDDAHDDGEFNIGIQLAIK